MAKAIKKWQELFLFFCILLCFGLLPVTFGYLDVSGGDGGGISSIQLNSDEELGEASAEDQQQQLHHTLRHQQHRSHRIEEAVNDYKNSQSEPWQIKKNISSSSLYGRKQVNLRHHRRLALHSTTTTGPQTLTGHHHQLRHHNRHHQAWENRVFPALRHQQTTTTTAATTTTMRPLQSASSSRSHNNFAFVVGSTANRHPNNGTQTYRRFYDRDVYNSMSSSRSKIADSIIPTHGPKARDFYNTRSHSSRPSWSTSYKSQLKDRTYDDDHRFAAFDNSEIDANKKHKIHSKMNKKFDYHNEESDEDDEYTYNDSEQDNDDYDEDEEETNDNKKDNIDKSQESSLLNDENSSYDEINENRNKIDINDNRRLPKRRINNDDIENIYSRHSIPGVLTRHKYEELGTHDAVKKSQKQHLTTQREHKALASAHAKKIITEASCRNPRPRIERIQKDPSKVYKPHCTILHRCSDDTGCCSTERETCVAKRTQSVDLYFFVQSFNSKQGTIERHTFVNHTECHCVEKSRMTSANLMQNLHPEMIRQATVLDCTCPKLYEKVLQENGICRCDCSSGNTGCDWLKRGMEHFSMADRKCILEGRCKLPTCEYGIFMKKHGRCPRRDDKMSLAVSPSLLSSRSYH